MPPVSAIMPRNRIPSQRAPAARLAATACVALLLALGLFATGARAEAAPDELERRLAMDEDSAPVMLDGRVLDDGTGPEPG